MPDKGVVKDTTTGLFCKTYSTSVNDCEWGNENQALEFPTLAGAESAANDMNMQLSVDGRFIGERPRPR